MNNLFRLFPLLTGLCIYSSTFCVEPVTNNPLLSNLRPWCIGRLVFDRPASSEISNETYEWRGETLETTRNTARETYLAKVEARESELRLKQRYNPVKLDEKTGRSWLEKTFSPVSDSRVFIYQEGEAKSVKLPFESEGYIYYDRTLFHTTGRIGPTGLDISESIYKDMYRRIKARDNWTVPTEPGFCFNGGIVSGSSTYPEDVSQSFALMPGRPALLLIKMREAYSEDQTQPLFKNLSALSSRLNHMPGSYHVLRKAKRKIAGMDAQEILFVLHDGPVTAFRFYLLAPGNPATLTQPHTSIELLLGAPSQSDLPPGQATSPVDEAGALQLWDTLLNSLRVRSDES
ncbi:T6SS immunity protein Tli4 family protein [Paraburkholderia sp. D15]|uniref:T6SS immunity protein Tli4 family protein n=1 Tax=Paraburkholderia sp. D15 TaxID=2880218 RepID=UPI002478C13E|nr:T6SS immunity protein Tli4 family protein [Paraburkholderia sp. D15]WGS51924.1 T6SS immunity protein Tli4 family protein [Paraburkholderia sp. D15]